MNRNRTSRSCRPQSRCCPSISPSKCSATYRIRDRINSDPIPGSFGIPYKIPPPGAEQKWVRANSPRRRPTQHGPYLQLIRHAKYGLAHEEYSEGMQYPGQDHPYQIVKYWNQTWGNDRSRFRFIRIASGICSARRAG